MKDGLFAKYFRTTTLVILLSIIFLGIILLLFSSRYFREDRFELLSNNLTQAVAITQADYRISDYQYIHADVLEPLYEALSHTLQSDILLVDSQGRTLLCSEGENCVHMNYMVPDDIMADIALGGHSGLSNFGGVYENSHFIVGMPLINPETNTVVGAIFASSDAASLNVFLGDMLGIFALSALGSLLVASVLVSYFSKRLSEPLMQISAATARFSRGDFSMPIPNESEDEIGEIARSLNNMATHLSSSEAMRRGFVANVSHELKTPMTTISGFVDGILDGTIPPDRQTHYLEIVSTETKRLSRLVRSMLSLSRIEAGEMKLSPAPVDLTELFFNTVLIFEPNIEEKQVEIRGLDTPRIMVYADSDLTHQVVYNLVENAVKFVNSGGYIEFSFRTVQDVVIASVTNSGDGIQKEEFPQLFERFYKSDKSRGLDKTGVGLGLYLVKTILGFMDGNITVSSVVGDYATFEFSLPAFVQTPPPTTPTPPQKEGGLFRWPDKSKKSQTKEQGGDEKSDFPLKKQ